MSKNGIDNYKKEILIYFSNFLIAFVCRKPINEHLFRRYSDFAIILLSRLPIILKITVATFFKLETIVLRYSGATVQDFHLFPYDYYLYNNLS